MKPTLSLLAVSLAASPALALDPIPGEERFEGLSETQAGGTIGAQLLFRAIDEDFFLTITPRLELTLGENDIIGLGLQVPLNLRVVDRDPENTGDYGGALRREDWDETREYLKVVRYFRYGHKRDPLYVRAGELAASLGHGTIIGRYLNNVDLNSFHVGLQADVNMPFGGLETLVSDIAFPQLSSQLLGARGYVKPVFFVDPESRWNIFQVGLTLVGDLNAPDIPDKDRAVTVVGFDTEVIAYASELLDVVPYTDLNFIGDAGWGWHLGVMTTLRLPLGLVVPARLEYRRFASNYVPSYFSSFYEVERFAYSAGNVPTALDGQPKGRVVHEMDPEPGLNGIYADAAVDIAGLVQLGAIYEDYDAGDPNLAVFLIVPALSALQFKAYYARTGITGTDDIFVFDDRSIAIAQARLAIAQYTYLVLQGSRRWNRVEGSDPPTFEASDEWQVGLEISIGL